MNGAERPPRRRYGRIIVVFLILVGIAWIVWQLCSLRAARDGRSAPPDARAPDGVRIKVEVLNAT